MSRAGLWQRHQLFGGHAATQHISCQAPKLNAEHCLQKRAHTGGQQQTYKTVHNCQHDTQPTAKGCFTGTDAHTGKVSDTHTDQVNSNKKL